METHEHLYLKVGIDGINEKNVIDAYKNSARQSFYTIILSLSGSYIRILAKSAICTLNKYMSGSSKL